MLVKPLLLLIAFFIGVKSEIIIRDLEDPLITRTVYPDNIKNLKTLEEFINMVQKHDMNVSLIMSSAKKRGNGNLKEVVTLTFTFPTNNKILKKSELKSDDLYHLAEIAKEEKLAVSGTYSTDDRSDFLGVMTNFPQGFPVNEGVKIVSVVNNGKTGFVFDEENYVAQYTFKSYGEDGKNETTRVLHGDLDVVIIDSHNVVEEYIEAARLTLAYGLMAYAEEDVPRVIANNLKSLFLPAEEWEVVGGVGDHNYIDAKKWILMEVLETKFLAYVAS